MIQQLQYNLAQMAEQLSDVLHKVDTLENKLSGLESNGNNCDSKPRVLPVTVPAMESVVNTNVAADPQRVAVEVHRVLTDAARRKNNVVLSGLPEDPESELNTTEHDERAFLNLREEHFSIKPSISKLGCRFVVLVNRVTVENHVNTVDTS